MTQLKKRMLDELQRRNYAQSTVRSYIYSIEDFARYSASLPINSAPNKFALIRFTYSGIASYRPEQWKGEEQRCGFSTSRRFGDRI